MGQGGGGERLLGRRSSSLRSWLGLISASTHTWLSHLLQYGRMGGERSSKTHLNLVFFFLIFFLLIYIFFKWGNWVGSGCADRAGYVRVLFFPTV